MTRSPLLPFAFLVALAAPAQAEISLTPIQCPYAAVAFAIVGAKCEMDGVAAEYGWLRTNRPGWKRDHQAMLGKHGRKYDVLTISRGGETEAVCFDITDFFGKL